MPQPANPMRDNTMSTPPRLIEELSFYRKYHRQPVNVGIHVVCIPLILLSSAYILSQFRVPQDLALRWGVVPETAQYLNAAMLLSVYFAMTYLRLDPIYGAPTGSVLIMACMKFTEMQPKYGWPGTKYAWILWTVCWVLQFIGHGVFEGRAPALLDNLHQALVLAPFFAIFEVSHLFGLRTEVLDYVDANLARLEGKKED